MYSYYHSLLLKAEEKLHQAEWRLGKASTPFNPPLEFTSRNHHFLPMRSEWLRILSEGPVPDEITISRGGAERWAFQKLHAAISRSRKICEVLMSCLYVCGYNHIGDVDWGTVMGRWFVFDLYGVSIPNLKYHCVWLSNRKRDCPIDRSSKIGDLDGLLVDGRVRTWMLRKIDRGGWNAWRLSETCFQGLKRGFPSMREDEVNQAITSFGEGISVSPPKPLLPLIEAVRRTAREIFGKEGITFSECDLNYAQGRRAVYEQSIEAGGGLGYVYRRCLTSGKTTAWFNPGELLRYERRVDRFEQPRAVYGTEWDWVLMRQTFSEVVPLSEFMDLDRRLRVKVSAIYEPLKVRLITKGEGDYYCHLKPLQQRMWECLQRFECFRLTGQECSTEDVQSCLNKPGPWSLSRMLVSGDYKDSTNTLSIWLTKAAYTEAAGDFQTLAMFNACLGTQIIESGLRGKSAWPQNNGQLMGSPLSFPILCVINAAIGRLAYERVTGETWRLDQLPMLVNGDDFLARMDRRTQSEWDNLAHEVGWELSVGKSYYHHDYCQINSQTRLVYWQRDCGQFRAILGRRIPYVNMGLLHQMGKHAVQHDDFDGTENPLDWRERWSSLAHLGKIWCDRAREVLRVNLERRLQDLKGLGRIPMFWNLDNPPHQGGLGLGGSYSLYTARQAVKYMKTPSVESLSVLYQMALVSGDEEYWRPSKGRKEPEPLVIRTFGRKISDERLLIESVRPARWI